MHPLNVPKMTLYLDALKVEDDCQMLLQVELSGLHCLAEDPSVLEWADKEGHHVLHMYWLVAETPARQAQLGRICRLRAIAWDAVYRTCFPATRGHQTVLH